MKARSAFSIQRDVIFAIFLREMTARFSSYTFGNIWLLVEPILMMTLFLLILGARGRGAFGYVEPPVFVFAAFLPYRMLWLATMGRNAGALGGALGLLGFRQVRQFDVFMTRTFVEGGLFLVVGTILMLALVWFGFDPWPKDPLLTLAYCMALWLFGASFGILVCVLAGFAPEVRTFVGMMSMPMLFASAVFFPMTVVPASMRGYLDWNPILHALELIREAWFGSYVSPVASESYLFGCMIVFLALAISTYRLRWQRLVAR